jgi:phosphatidylserine/phosphatidylglycerophosphate/cardiolipin synthase-like enzyme
MIEVSGLAPRTFKRRFAAATGYAPIDYVQTLRIEEAKHLLETTVAPTDDIGAQVGYEDPASFRRTSALTSRRAPRHSCRSAHEVHRGARPLALQRWLAACVFSLWLGSPWTASAGTGPMAIVDAQVQAHPGRTGVYVLDAPVEALLARAWLADSARESIEVQYFIWSTDNIGILAAEALLRAAERGVQGAGDRRRPPDRRAGQVAAGAGPASERRHPHLQPASTSVGVPLMTRVLNAVTRFRGVNQRMHDKTLVVDGKVAITGGRNMAAEYFDYNHRYNFRDRDVLLLGEAVKRCRRTSSASGRAAVGAGGVALRRPRADAEERPGHRRRDQQIYNDLHAYARSPENFAPEVRSAIDATPAPSSVSPRRWSGARSSSSATCPARTTAVPAWAAAGTSAPRWPAWWPVRSTAS